ncbi:hypothetical protein [Streptomyces canus]|uniref:hypothetical protein n=1 Tax=Streptomyces canus TaxID=58343 RepID=UPI003719FE3F
MWRWGVSAAAGEFAAEVEILAVCLLQGIPQCLCFFSVLLLEAGDLAGQREDEGALLVGRSGRCGGGTGLGPESFDAAVKAQDKKRHTVKSQTWTEAGRVVTRGLVASAVCASEDAVTSEALAVARDALGSSAVKTGPTQ